VWTLFSTSIVIRSDSKQIAIAADSKSPGYPGPFCKLRVIPGGIVAVGGFGMAESTLDGKTTRYYEALPLGVEAAMGETEPWGMISRFTLLFEPKAQNFVRALVDAINTARQHNLVDVLSRISDTWGRMLAGGEPVVQIAFAVNHNGRAAFYRRQFFNVPIFRDKQPFITYRDESCPGTCTEPGSKDSYTTVGIDDISAYIGVHPEMFSRPPLEFSTFFVRQVIHDFGSIAGEPITTVTLDSSGRPWHFHDVGACEDEAQKAAAIEQGKKEVTCNEAPTSAILLSVTR
jgi:hypothetical protein